MGDRICFIKGREQGNWFQIECVKNDIISKESRGEDAKFERGLLRAWGKHTGWSSATDVLASLKKPTHTRVKAIP